MNKDDKLISFKKDRFYTVLAIFTFALGILVGYFIWGTTAPDAASAQVSAESNPEAGKPPEERTIQRYDIPTDGFPSIGPADAEITLIEFSDFGCAFCGKWHNETFENLMAAYPDQIRFVYREVPFRAFSASEASKCAEEQDAYWAYHDKLFSGEYGLSDKAYIQYAEDLNLDLDAFNTCVSEHRYREAIQADMDFGTQLGIGSTPTFFINGLAMVGAQPIEAFKKLIDEELAGEIPR